jgi:hypothetical protein
MDTKVRIGIKGRSCPETAIEATRFLQQRQPGAKIVITGPRDGSPASFDRRPMAKRRLAAVRPFLAAISSGALSHPRTTLYRPEQIESLHQIKDAPLVHLPLGA